MNGPGVAGLEWVEEELFARQVLAAMRVAPMANAANAVNIVVLSAYVARPGHPVFAVVWMALALGAASLRVAVWWLGRSEAGHGLALSRRYYGVSVVEVCLQGALNSVLLGYLVPRVDQGRQMLLVASLAGVLGAGAVALSTVRSVGALWVVIHVVGVIPTFLAMGRTAYSVLSAQLAVYGAVLVVVVVLLSDSFKRRSLAEINARHAHQVVELLLDDFEDGSRDWLWETDSDGALTHASERLAELSGYPVESLRGLGMMELLGRLAHPSEGGRQSVEELATAMASGATIRDHLLHVEVGGSEHWWAISAKPRRDADGAVVGWRGVGADTTQAHTHALEMVRLAQTDPLTALANRRLFQEALDSVLEGEPGPGEVHLAIFDLDNFKVVNDTLGHSVGDELLVQVAVRMAACREGDFIARLGGDEFAVVTQPASPPDFAELLFAPYQAVFTEPFFVRGNQLHVTASVGCARAWPRTTRAEELVGRADLALYSAKAAGPGRMSSFTSSMSMRARQRASLVTDLERAIARQEFLLHYQSQHDLRTGKVVATEALLRWQHPSHGLLPPSEFLEVAEASGLLVPIGGLMLRQACRKLATLEGGVRVAFNVSQSELDASGFLDQLERALDEFGIEPHRFELEVTETAAGSPQSESLLREAAELGVRIAIDDFGVGYSSLARLQRMPVDVLKVDRSFAAALRESDPRSADVARAIMKSAVDISSALGIEVLAEGIEDADQLAQVRALGFDLAQGYFVATPAPDLSRHLRLVESPPEG